MKKKTWKSLIICLAVLLVGAGGVIGALLLRNNATSKHYDVVSGEMTVEDAEDLRAVLLANGECTITLAEDIVVTEELLVNGTKTLAGNKSIIMDTSNIGTTASVCAVNDDATLILDGATLDGNGVVNGISVKVGGTLTCLSGNVVYGYPYGMTIAGTADIKNVKIDNAMHTGIYVEFGGKATMTGGTIQNDLYGIAVASGASMSIGDAAVITKANADLIINYGTVDITGGKYHDAYGHGIINKGQLTVAGTADKKIEISNVGKSGIAANKSSKLNASNLYIHDAGTHAFCVEKKTEANIQDCVVEKTGKSSVYVNNSTLAMENVTISDVSSYAIYATKNSNATIKKITVEDAENRGIVNDAATVTANDIVIKNTKKNAFHTMGEKAVTKMENIQIITPNSNAIAAVSGGNVNAKNVTIEEPKNEGLFVNADSKIEIENVTINQSGMTSVANNGGTFAARNITITSPKNIGIKTTDGGTTSVRGATITATASHALAVEKGSSLTISDCKMEKIGWEKEKAAVYVSKSKMTMKDTQVHNVSSYGIYVTDGEKTSDKAIYLDNVTLTKVGTDAKKHRGIANVNSMLIMTKVKVTDTAGAGIYTKGEKSVTQMNNIEVTNAGTCGLGVTGGQVQARNITIVKPKNEGVYIAKGAIVKNLDNATITDPGAQGINNVGGTIHVTVNKTYNPDNTKENGVTITNPGTSAIKSVGGTITVRSSTIKNVKNHAFDIEGGSDATVNYCTIDKTGMSAVYVLESKFTMKNTQMDNIPSYGIYAKNSKKADGKGATLENITLNKPGNNGIVSENSLVTVKNADILNSEADGIYVAGADAVMNINGATIKDAKGCGIFNNGAGTVTAKNVDIKNVVKYGVYVAKEKGTVKLDNVTIDTVTDKERDGINCVGNLIVTAKNDEKNGVTITNVASGNGIYVAATGVVTADGVKVDNVSKKGLNVYGKLTVSNLTINKTKEHGVQSAAGAETTILGCNISNTNTAGSTTAVVYAKESILTVKEGQIDEAPTHAIYVEKATVEIKDTAIINPGSEGIMNLGGTITADGVTITGAKGCAIWNKESGVITAKNTQISDVSKYGIFVENGTTANLDNVTIENVLGDGNERNGIQCAGTLNITSDNEEKNGVTIKTVASGNGLYVASTGNVKATRVKISGTSKKGLYVSGGKANITDKLTVSNTQQQAVQSYEGAEITIAGFKLSNTNQDGSSTTAVYVSNAKLTMKNGKITDVPARAIFVENSKKTDGKGALLDNVTISNPGDYGIEVDNGDVEITASQKASEEDTVNNGVTITSSVNHGIYVKAGSISADRVNIIDSAKKGIYLNNGNATVSNLTINNAGNQAIQIGYNSQVTITGFNIDTTGNAAIYTMGSPASSMTLTNGTVIANKQGIYVDGSSQVTATNVTVERKAGNANPLVVICAGSTFALNEADGGTSRIDGNSSKGETYVGRGVELKGTFILNGGTICDNKVTSQAGAFNTDKPKDAGGVYVLESGTFTMNGGKIENNTGDCGGAVSVYGTNASFSMLGGTIQNNNARAGAAVMVRKGSFTMGSGKITGNTATENGGAIYLPAGSNFTMNGGEITNNEAKNHGGAIYLAGKSTVTLNVGKIEGNKAKLTESNGIYGNGSGNSQGSLVLNAGFLMSDNYNNKLKVTDNRN